MKKIIVTTILACFLFIFSATIAQPKNILAASYSCDPGFHPCNCHTDALNPLSPMGPFCCFNSRSSGIITFCYGKRNPGVTENPYPWRDIYTCGPTVPEADGTSHPAGIQTALGCVVTNDLTLLLPFILRLALGAAGGIILLMLIATGYTLLTSQGNPEKLQAVKENIISIFSGLILIGFSLVLLQTIGADILKLPTF